MNQNSALFLMLSLGLLMLASQTIVVEAQLFDQIMNGNSNNNNPQQQSPSRFTNMFKDMMSVNVPIFYDMVKNGTSMGINVLSGLVKVERGEEAERSGLQGRRPLSVRVFGVPVYERGQRVGFPESPSSSFPIGGGREPKVEGAIDDEELPIDP